MSIKKSIIILAIAIVSACQESAEKDAMNRLESAIAQKSTYEEDFKRRTDKHKALLKDCTSSETRWDLTRDLYTEYLCYDIDSAIVYTNLMADQADNPEKEMIALEARISCLCALRRYTEAMEIINSVDTTDLSNLQKQAYYSAHIALYTALGNEASTKDDYITPCA